MTDLFIRTVFVMVSLLQIGMAQATEAKSQFFEIHVGNLVFNIPSDRRFLLELDDYHVVQAGPAIPDVKVPAGITPPTEPIVAASIGFIESAAWPIAGLHPRANWWESELLIVIQSIDHARDIDNWCRADSRDAWTGGRYLKAAEAARTVDGFYVFGEKPLGRGFRPGQRVPMLPLTFFGSPVVFSTSVDRLELSDT